MSRCRSRIHAALPCTPEAIELQDRPLQRRTVACARDDGLDVPQREEPAERDFREAAPQLGEAIAGHNRDGLLDGWTVGRSVWEISFCYDFYDRRRSGVRELVRFAVSAEQNEICGLEIALRDLDPHPFDPLLALSESGRVDEPKRKALDDGVRFNGIAGRARNLRDNRALGAEQRVEERRLASVGPARDDEQRPFAQSLAFGRGFQEISQAITHDAPRTTHAVGRHRPFLLRRKVDVVCNQRFELENLVAEGGQAIREPTLELLQRATSLRR